MLKSGLLALGVLFSSFSLQAATIPWSQWLQELRRDATAQGIDGYYFDQLFANIYPSKKVLKFDRSQPEKRLTFMKYRKTRGSAYRISLGKKAYRKYASLLNDVEAEFAVDPCFIMSIWGMETSYGNFMGKFPVLNSLVTLAYDNRRAAFFRKELLMALHILSEGHVSLRDFKGEWAGASGHPQFLPSSWHRYAVDFNGDGRRDIWGTHSDVFASIANYLKQNGWQSGEPWAIPVELPANFNMDLEGKKHEESVADWQAMGVRTADGRDLPRQDLSASIITPYGGPALLAYKNFKVIMRYNNSTYYAGTIGYMADKICNR